MVTPSHLDYLRILERWPAYAERFWWNDPARPDLGCFGSGYNSWGVQTNQKYLGAMAVLATHPELDEAAAGCSREAILDRALRALRYSLATHVSGDHHCSDGTRWGHTWISALGIERMMHGVEALEEHLTDLDLAGLRRMLISEADALLAMEVQGTKWARDGGNKPESNIWNGAILARVCRMYPDDARVPDWMEKAHRFLMNGISIAADALDEREVAGRPIREWHVGPNFFDHYALDHHGYLNVGYMVICLSNIAFLHFACATHGWAPPESLHHHAADLWGLLKRLLFADGRLLRIGGDSRQRYCYCQDYLLPTLLYCAHYLDDAHATELEAGALDLIRQEQAASGDGSFHSRRLGRILEINPYYYTRLESDKAVVLSMGAYWRRRCRIAPTPAKVEYEDAVAGGWEEPEHGAVFHRSKRRLASWSWRAREAPQGLCLPPTSGHLAEWCENLGGRVRLLGEQGSRTVLEHQQWSFPGGFLTTGTMADSTKAVLPEGWISPERAAHRYAVAALPDDRTLVVLEYCRVGIRAYLTEAKGLKLNIPNDLFNDFRRTYRTASSIVVTTGDAAGSRSLESSWANIDDALGVVGLYGADSLWLFQAGRRRASGYGESLYYDEVCFPCRTGMWSVDHGSVILDCGSLVLSGVTAEETESAGQQAWVPACEDPLIRAVVVGGGDGHTYLLVVHFGDRETETAVELGERASAAVDLVSGTEVRLSAGRLALTLGSGEARLARLR